MPPTPSSSALTSSSQDALDAATLVAANINPKTRLATDYLNHFNEAIMLLEIIPAMPECAEDFLRWEPLSYPAHFRQSNFKARDLAIAAYEQADPEIRTRFDGLCDTLTGILTAIHDAMSEATQASTRARLAEQATGWLKPLVIQAGGVINGASEAQAEEAEPQSDADLIMSA
ncbi:hypothetical protein [Bradyrhizobium sp. LHD-71]|uniref:hypothetical protein n=1 Tax=Bradyrhizobium sp. LHD-71 TaxID=3072141 RepID=UPI00281001EC|nr:hypothetical protein [Bradyrhizobium sp. LHD-71]MDQ8731472.1 hypothetical protein [Bradyrhizobium sp. LHD-71]